MIRNFKILFLFVFMFSCDDKGENNEQISMTIINQNFEVLMDSISYFDLSKVSESIEENIHVSLNAEVATMNVQESEIRFRNKFKFKSQKLNLIFLKIKVLPLKKVDNYPISLVCATSEVNNHVNVSFVNCFLDKSQKFASITVIKSRGIGAKFEIYYFKQVNGKWIFDGKELLALG